jgi:predicted nucleotidyltransferase
MSTVDRILRTIAQNKEQLRSEFGVIGIGIFGSVVREEQNAGSDIDILVEFERPIGFVRFMRLEKRFAELLGMPVDLVTRKALKPHIGRRILQEVRYV